MRAIRKFQVGIKALMVHQGALLMLQENRPARTWEIPGGRIDEGEERLEQEKILAREITEELGPEVRYRIRQPLITWVRELVPGDYPEHYVFLIGYLVEYAGGDIRLSGEHLNWRWVGPDDWPSLELADGYRPALEKFWPAYKRIPDMKNSE